FRSGQRLVDSMCTLATLIGLSVTQLTQGTIVGNLGFSEVAFPAPLFHGDTLYAETTILDKRNSKSRPGQGIVTLEHRGYTQHGTLVAKAVRQTLMFASSHERETSQSDDHAADARPDADPLDARL